jgi:hypothetical protein
MAGTMAGTITIRNASTRPASEDPDPPDALAPAPAEVAVTPPDAAEVFADATFSVRLAGDAVEITMGDATCAGTVPSRDGDASAGELVASGTAFDFATVREGEILRLESGGSACTPARTRPANRPRAGDALATGRPLKRFRAA